MTAGIGYNAPAGSGSGAVTSVNTRTGAVVLTAADVGAGQLPAGVLLDSGIIIPSGADISGILGTSGSKAAAGNDSRLSDTRTPTDGSVTNAKVAGGAAIALSKLATDPLARANHTGTQTMSTISDAGALATKSAVASADITDGSIVGGDLSASIVLPASAAASTQSAAAAVARYDQRPGYFKMRSGALAENYSRSAANVVNTAAATTSVCQMCAIELYAGMVIGHITFFSGTSALATATHQWFFLTDSSRVQVATTTDDTSTAWGALAEKTLAVSQIASGASATYTVPTSGLYYVGQCVTASGTVPSMLGVNASGGTLLGLAPIICGTSDTIATGPPSFAKTYGAITASAKEIWCYVSA